MSNVPKLRFSEFIGEWEEKKLENYGKLINGLTYSPDNIVEKGLLVLRSSNIQNQQISFHDNVYVDLDIKEEYLTKENDILICVRNGSKRLIGKSLLIQNNLPKATHGAFMTVFRGESNKFISHWFKTPIFFKEVYKNLGATINSINGSDLKKFKTIFPLKQEQEKIASFLTSVDTKIEQLTKKESLLQEYKKGVMQKIFNQEVRFKDEDGNEFCEWELEELAKYLIKHDEKTTTNNQYPVLTSSRKGLFFQKDYFDGNDVASNDTTGYNVVPRGYFTYRHMSDDLIFKVNINNIVDKGIVSTLYPVFTTKNINNYFLQIKLNEGNEFKRYVLIQKQGGSRTYMYFKKLQELKVNLPCIKEQTKIVNFLSSIDKKIENAKDEVEKTKQFKKALIQQMFV